MTDVPAIMTCTSIISREMVQIALTLAALNDLELEASKTLSLLRLNTFQLQYSVARGFLSFYL